MRPGRSTEAKAASEACTPGSVTLTHQAAAEASSSRIPPGPEAFDRKVWIRRGTAGFGRMFVDANRAHSQQQHRLANILPGDAAVELAIKMVQ